MKFGIWAYTVVVGISVYVLEMISRAFPGLYQPMAVDKPPPVLTGFVLEYRLWFYAIPVIWVIAAIVICRKSVLTKRRAGTFVTASVFMIAAIYGTVVYAFVIPLCATIKELGLNP